MNCNEHCSDEVLYVCICVKVCPTVLDGVFSFRQIDRT